MKTFRNLAALMLAMAMVFSLAACSGGSGNNSQPPSNEPDNPGHSESSEAPSDEPAGDAPTFATVESGKLHMATNAQFPPYEMTTDSGGYEGIDVEIATAIAAKLGLELVVDDMDFKTVITAVQQGISDMAMAGLTVDPEREKNVDFTVSYATGVQVIIVTKDSDIASVDDLGGKLIGVQEGTTGWMYCSDDYGDDAVVAYDNGSAAVQALLAGSVDCVVIDNEPAKAYVAANAGLKILDTEYVVEDYAIGVSKDNPALRDAINAALEELIADGTVKDIIDKYIPPEG